MAKRPHIAALTASPRIAEAWERRHGRAPTEADIDALYEVFVPKNVAVAAAYAEVIPGVAEVVKELRAQGVKIGSSTGYTREIMAKITPRAAEQGFAPDSLVCTGDTSEGPTQSADVLQGPARSRRLAGVERDQDRRHDGRRRRGGQRRRLERRRRGQRQCVRAFAGRYESAWDRRISRAAARGRRTRFMPRARIMSSIPWPIFCRSSPSSRAGSRAASGRDWGEEDPTT